MYMWLCGSTPRAVAGSKLGIQFLTSSVRCVHMNMYIIIQDTVTAVISGLLGICAISQLVSETLLPLLVCPTNTRSLSLSHLKNDLVINEYD